MNLIFGSQHETYTYNSNCRKDTCDQHKPFQSVFNYLGKEFQISVESGEILYHM